MWAQQFSFEIREKGQRKEVARMYLKNLNLSSLKFISFQNIFNVDISKFETVE